MAHLFYVLTHIAEVLIPMFEWLGPWSYLILFVIVFMETGLVVFPWLPGGSLVFLTSSFIAVHPILKMHIVVPVFFLAAFIGDSVNYWIGHSLSRWHWIEKRLAGPRMLTAKEYLNRYGFWAVAFGRFVPLIRSFIPLPLPSFHHRQLCRCGLVGSSGLRCRLLLWLDSPGQRALLPRDFGNGLLCGSGRGRNVGYQSAATKNY